VHSRILALLLVSLALLVLGCPSQKKALVAGGDKLDSAPIPSDDDLLAEAARLKTTGAVKVAPVELAAGEADGAGPAADFPAAGAGVSPEDFIDEGLFLDEPFDQMPGPGSLSTIVGAIEDPRDIVQIDPDTGLYILFYHFKHVWGFRQILKGSGGTAPLSTESANTDQRALTVNAVISILKSNINLAAAGEKLEYVPYSNVLVVKASKGKIDRVKDMLALLDRPRPQVAVKVKIAEIVESSDFQFGMEFAVNRQSPNSDDMTFDSFKTTLWPSSYVDFLVSSSPAGFQGSTISFTTLTGASPEPWIYTLRALEELGLADIVSEPEMVVAQGEIARIKSGEDVPFQVVTTSGNTTNVSVSFKQVGVKLYITPITVNPDGVLLHIYAEFSFVSGFITSELQKGVTNPIIAVRNAETTVFLNFDQTLRVGGLKLVEQRDDDSRIPYIGKIPILGDLLSSKRRDLRTTELYFFVTPGLYHGTGLPQFPFEE